MNIANFFSSKGAAIGSIQILSDNAASPFPASSYTATARVVEQLPALRRFPKTQSRTKTKSRCDFSTHHAGGRVLSSQWESNGELALAPERATRWETGSSSSPVQTTNGGQPVRRIGLGDFTPRKPRRSNRDPLGESDNSGSSELAHLCSALEFMGQSTRVSAVDANRNSSSVAVTLILQTAAP